MKCGNDGNLRPGGDDGIRCGSRTGFLDVLIPSMSIKDRSLWQC